MKMGIFKNIRNFFKKSNKSLENTYGLEKLSMFLNQDCFLSVKDKNAFLDTMSEYQKFTSFNNDKSLKEYCLKNKYDFDSCQSFVKTIQDLDKNIKQHNDEYVKRHLEQDGTYLDTIFEKVDSSIRLDKEQKNVILRDEDYTLVIAGAGAGKSTTVAAKVKYLVDIKKINPKQILVISYTNKAVDELKKRINGDFKIDCPITTFHSTGYAIIRKENTEKVKIVSSDYLYKCLNDFLSDVLLLNESLLYKTVLFFSYYIDMDIEINTIEDVKKLREFTVYQPLEQQISKFNESEIEKQVRQRKTIRYERLRSVEEVKIANFLYLNGIDYEYEKPYPYYIPGMKRPYLPDFTLSNHGETIYLEHFGITEDGKNSYYDEETLKKYIQTIEWKKSLHQKHKTKFIYTYSSYHDHRDLLEDLKHKLLELNVEFRPRNQKEIFQQLTKAKDSRCYKRLLKLLGDFIHNFKTNGWEMEDFERLSNETTSERNKVFLEIAKAAYVYYQTKLEEGEYKDFHDLINDSTKILKDKKSIKDKLSFKYIIIDEYQDISLQRFNLAKSLSEITDAKIIAVGDDWQSIYSFAGSRLKLFTEFEKSMGYAEILRITHTYRNSQELINIAGSFIQKNEDQYKKNLISPKHLPYPVAIFTYSDNPTLNKIQGKNGVMIEKAMAIERALSAIVKRNKKDDLSILLIGRFGFDGYQLGETPLFECETDYNHNKTKLVSKKYPNLDIEFMTAHSSKGIGKDEVILINSSSGIWGFPCEKKYDPVLNMVIYNDRSYEDAEERRLFYVALTRTKNRVYIIAPRYSPSKFLLEIKDENDVYKDYTFEDVTSPQKRLGNYCPHCGFPLYYTKSVYFDKSMYICSNDSEVCGFVSNNIKGGKTSIKKCPDCQDGYLFIKKMINKEHYFLGCTNYKNDKTGCNHTEELES